MAPWTLRSIAGQLEKLTPRNTDEVAKRVVDLVETRAQVQRMAVLVGRRASRLYAQTFHPVFDQQRRALCDSFISSLVKHFALRHKRIRGVPLPGIGLFGEALIKAELLSIWIIDGGQTGIGPVAASLYKTGHLSLDDIIAVIESCLGRTYLSALNGRNRSDAILLLEVAGRDIDAQRPRQIDDFFACVQQNHADRPKGVDIRQKSGERENTSLQDRYRMLQAERAQGWRGDPSRSESESTSPATDKSQQFNEGLALAPRTSSLAAMKTARNSSESGEDDERSLYDDDDDYDGSEDDSETSLNTPSTVMAGSGGPSLSNTPKRRRSSTRFLPAGPIIDGEDGSRAYDAAFRRFSSLTGEPEAEYGGNVLDDDETARPASPWAAYFSNALRGVPSFHSVVHAEGQGEREVSPADVAALDASDKLNGGNKGIEDDEDDAMSIMSAADLAVLQQRRESEASTTSMVKRKPLSAPTSDFAPSLTRNGSLAKGQRAPPDVSSPGQHVVSFGQALEGGFEAAPPAGASRAPSMRRGLSGHRHALSASAAISSVPTVGKLPGVLDDKDAIWISLDASHDPKERPLVRVRFPSRFQLGDARRLARLFGNALHSKESLASVVSGADVPTHIQFLPRGVIGQTLSPSLGREDGVDDIFVEYAPSMTLASTRQAALRLAATLAAYMEQQRAA